LQESECDKYKLQDIYRATLRIRTLQNKHGGLFPDETKYDLTLYRIFQIHMSKATEIKRQKKQYFGIGCIPSAAK
jgi:hypothetical protein